MTDLRLLTMAIDIREVPQNQRNDRHKNHRMTHRLTWARSWYSELVEANRGGGEPGKRHFKNLKFERTLISPFPRLATTGQSNIQPGKVGESWLHTVEPQLSGPHLSRFSVT